MLSVLCSRSDTLREPEPSCLVAVVGEQACRRAPCRLFLRQQQKAETERERLLTAYALHGELMQGHFPLTHEMALEMAALMAQVSGPWATRCGLAAP